MFYGLSKTVYSYENGHDAESIGPDFTSPQDVVDFVYALELPDTSNLEVCFFTEKGAILSIHEFSTFEALHEISINYVNLISDWYTQQVIPKPEQDRGKNDRDYHVCPVCYGAWYENIEEINHYDRCWIPKILGEEV